MSGRKTSTLNEVNLETPATTEDGQASAWQATDDAVNLLKGTRLKHKGEMAALTWILVLHAEKKLRLEIPRESHADSIV
jgi:hypothetical protein